MPVIQSRNNWSIETEESRMKKGPLVRVEIRPGQFVKIHQSELKNPSKAIYPQGDKLDHAAVQNKQTIEPGPVDPVVFDDLAAIHGLGQASARALNENGILTFAQLAAAGELSYLAPKVNASIMEWRSTWEG